MRLNSRIRAIGHHLRWLWLDWFDRVVFTAPVERVLNRHHSKSRRPVPSSPIKRLYLDVSVIEKNDAGTGIQRVVRSIRRYLPVALSPAVKLESLTVPSLRLGYITTSGEPLVGAPGSLFFGLDFATDSIYRSRHDLWRFKLGGGQVWFLVHDVLPLSHPQWFTHASCLKYRRWLRVCASLADGIFCVSPVVATQLRELISNRYGRTELPRISTIELGSDLTTAERELDRLALPIRDGLDYGIFERAALVVGTLEPRKGHIDVLKAFETLWNDGYDIPLILIGRAGWNTRALQSQIQQHPQRDRLLYWLDDVDDQGLQAAYHHCQLVIVPSLAEGYGLPLDEALAQGTPVLARDIPVFRRHEDTAVTYFPEKAGAAEIAACILAAHAAAANKPRRKAQVRNWEHTARQVISEFGCLHAASVEQVTDN